MRKNIDEHIRRAIEEGQFNDLPGQGRPLNLDENPLEDPEWRLANHLLKSNGFSLPWMETRKEILAGLESAREDLRRAHQGRLTAQVMKKSPALVEAEWERARAAFLFKLEELNRQIFSFNLQAPSLQFQLRALDPEHEVEKILSGE